MIDVHIVPVLKDNYAYILVGGGQCAVVDPGEPDPVLLILKQKGLSPDYILNTHHHGDHVAGNKRIKDAYGCKIVGPAAEDEKIIGLDILLDERSVFTFGGETVQIIETPGHTLGHICFYFPESKVLMAGDTLFSMGCGRVFEGTTDQMFLSLQRLKNLPGDTRLYCGHEYTLANGKFCLHEQPDNTAIQKRVKEVHVLCENGQPSLPTLLEDEMKTNVFLMAETPDEFARLRSAKDSF